MRTFLAILLILIGAAAAGAYFSAFIVRETEQAIVLEFGNPKQVIKQPGLHWKIPVAQTVDFFDKRILDLDTSPQELIASDQKRLVVDAFARFKIDDPLRFYQNVRDERIARQRLGALLEGSLRRALGGASFTDIVRDKREALMATITKQVDAEARELLGISVIDVRIKRADLPEANSEAVSRRMQTERQREAAEARAEGAAAANRIRAHRRSRGDCRPRPRPPGKASRCVVRATESATGSLPRHSARIPISSRSTGRCRPTAKA